MHDPHNPTSLSCNSLIKVHIDQSGTLWVGTNSGRFNIFNRETGTFTGYEFDPENPNSLGDDTVFSTYEDRSGIPWLGGCCTEISKIF